MMAAWQDSSWCSNGSTGTMPSSYPRRLPVRCQSFGASWMLRAARSSCAVLRFSSFFRSSSSLFTASWTLPSSLALARARSIRSGKLRQLAQVPGVLRRNSTRIDVVLELARERQELQAPGDGALRDAEPLGEPGLVELGVELQQLLVGARLLDRRGILAEDVLDQPELAALLLAVVANLGLDGLQASALRALEAAVTEDDLEAAVALGRDHDGLQEALGLDGPGQLLERLLGTHVPIGRCRVEELQREVLDALRSIRCGGVG